MAEKEKQIDEALQNVDWKLWLGTRDCPDCQGTGLRYALCKKCKGLAYVKCPDCKGTGKAVCKCVK